ncbi:hypothetical protein [Nonomuraea dietziae]|uniref:hypothetical protein n=1 Tax=Nonomuraea dietziae TaxID=65515 RepID=UPI003440CDF6
MVTHSCRPGIEAPVPDADHNLRPSSDGFACGDGRAAGYVKDPRADAPPAQALASEPIWPPAWHESPVDALELLYEAGSL